MPSFLPPNFPTPDANAPGGLQRRSIYDADLLAPHQNLAPEDDPYANDWAVKAARSSLMNTGNALWNGMPLLGYKLAGNEEGAQRNALAYRDLAEQARQAGPAIQSFDDAQAAGGGAGDYTKALAYQGVGLLPDLAAMATGAGVGEVAAKQVAQRVARRSIEGAIERQAGYEAGRIASREAAAAGARQAAVAKGVTDEGAVSALANSAIQQSDKTATRELASRAAEIAGRTPRIAARIDAAGTWGGRAGLTAAGLPAANAGNVDILSDPNSTQADALAVLGADIVGAGINALPYERFTGSLFGNEAKWAGKLPSRMAKEAGVQAAYGAAGNVIGTTAEKAAHAAHSGDWTPDENTAGDYGLSAALGAAFGAPMGAFSEAGGSALRAAPKLFGNAADMYRKGLNRFADWREARRNAATGANADGIKPGDEIPLDGGDSGGSGGVFARVLGALRGKKGESAAADTFNEHQDRAGVDGEADRMASDYEANGPALLRMGREVSMFKNPQYNLLMSHVSPDAPIWKDFGTAAYTARALDAFANGTTFKGASHDQIEGVVHALVDRGYMPRNVYAELAGARELRMAGKDGAPSAADNARDSAVDAMQSDNTASARAVDEGVSRTETDSTAVHGDGAINEQGANVAVDSPAQTPADAQAEAFNNVRLATQRLVEAKGRNDPEATRAAQADVNSALEASKTALGALRQSVLGKPSAKQPIGDNVLSVTAGNKKSEQFFERARNRPGAIELTDNAGNTHVLDMSSAIPHEVARNPSRYADADGNSLPPAQKYLMAFHNVLADAHQAGLKLNLDTLKPGTIENAKTKEAYTTISPKTAAELKAEFNKPGKLVAGGDGGRAGASHVSTGANARIRAEMVRDGVKPADWQREFNRRVNDRPYSSETSSQHGGAPGDLTEISDSIHERRPRQQPVGLGTERATDQATGKPVQARHEFVPTENVAGTMSPSQHTVQQGGKNVSVPGSEEGAIAHGVRQSGRTGKTRKAASTAKEQARSGDEHAAGVQIGEMRIQKEFGRKILSAEEGARTKGAIELADGRYLDPFPNAGKLDQRGQPMRDHAAEQLALLHDPTSGHAERYFEKAYRGDYETGGFKERKPDHEAEVTKDSPTFNRQVNAIHSTIRKLAADIPGVQRVLDYMDNAGQKATIAGAMKHSVNEDTARLAMGLREAKGTGKLPDSLLEQLANIKERSGDSPNAQKHNRMSGRIRDQLRALLDLTDPTYAHEGAPVKFDRDTKGNIKRDNAGNAIELKTSAQRLREALDANARDQPSDVGQPRHYDARPSEVAKREAARAEARRREEKDATSAQRTEEHKAKVREDLRKLGYSDAEISRMTPRERFDTRKAGRAKDEGRMASDEEAPSLKSLFKTDKPFDAKRWTDVAHALLKAAGVDIRGVHVTELPESAFNARRATASGGLMNTRKRGDYHRFTNEIRLHPGLKPEEQMQVLMHELGHHILFAEVAKHVGWDAVNKMSPAEALDALQQHNPELHAGLWKDFESWKASKGTSSPFFVAENSGGRRQSFANDQAAFHEWFADNVSRALTSQRKPVNIVERFFKSIADKIHMLWKELVRDRVTEKWAPAKSVDAYVRQLFSVESEAVRQTYGFTAPRAMVDTAVKAAIAEQRMRMETGEQHGPGRRAGNNTGVAHDPAAGAPNFELVSGKQMVPYKGPAFSLDDLIDVRDNVPYIRDGFMDFVKHVMSPEMRQHLDKFFNRRDNMEKLKALYAGSPEILKAMDDAATGLENRIAYGYVAFRAGEFNAVGPQVRSAFGEFKTASQKIFDLAWNGEAAHRILNDMANGTIQRVKDSGGKYDVDAILERNHGELNRFKNQATKVLEGALKPLSVAFNSGLNRMMKSGVPALRAMATAIHRPFDSSGDDNGYTPAVGRQSFRFNDAMSKVFGALSDEHSARVLDSLAQQIAPGSAEWRALPSEVRDGVTQMRALYKDAFQYLSDAGVKNRKGEAVGERELFHPVLFDLTDKDIGTKLTEFYSNPKWEPYLRKALHDNDAPIADLVKKVVDFSAQDSNVDFTAPRDAKTPNLAAVNARFSDFVQRHGSVDECKAFAALQTHSAADVYSRYFEPLVRRAEYERYFGGGKLDKMAADARAQGATSEQVAEGLNHVRAAMGVYGQDVSPVLKAIAPSLAEKVKGPKAMKIIQNVKAYQNLRNLQLAFLSSVVDPLGVGVRAGGDMKTAMKGFRAGMKSLVSSADRAQLHGMLRAMGVADDIISAQNLYGGKLEGFAGKVNNFVFKANGMEAWVKSTRVMAAVAAHEFLLRHAQVVAAGRPTSAKGIKAYEQSQRYLRELNVEHTDVIPETLPRPNGEAWNAAKLMTPEEYKAATPEAQKADDRVREGLRRFVDEAILRPHSLQNPLWHNDPYMGLITQYKAFSYAIYDQISGRIGREWKNGNLKVLAPAMMYVPIAAAAELTREFLQYGSDGNPQRANWTPGDYLELGAEKSGLMGPKIDIIHGVRNDMRMGSLPGSSYSGPTAGQVGDVKNTLIGRRSSQATVEGALPGASLMQHWNDKSNSQGVQARG